MKIEERLDKLNEKLQETRFLEMKGLGNEVPFYIFDYPAEKELLIRETVAKLKDSFLKKEINILEINLYDLVLGVLFERIPTEKIIDYEKKKGSNELLNKLRPMLKIDLVKGKISSLLSKEKYNIIFLTGIGNAWPLIRSHKVLNNLQSVISKIPLVVFYPGHYTKYDLNLFGKFKDANYYRAFRLIDYAEEEN
ncbi:DUF1788 domain-containing protein [archaeon]|nr:DUF1788 domain-containing protein [archaeon]